MPNQPRGTSHKASIILSALPNSTLWQPESSWMQLLSPRPNKVRGNGKRRKTIYDVIQRTIQQQLLAPVLGSTLVSFMWLAAKQRCEIWVLLSRRLMHPHLGLCVSLFTPQWIATLGFNCVGHNAVDKHLLTEAWQLQLSVHVLQDWRHLRRRSMSGARTFSHALPQ